MIITLNKNISIQEIEYISKFFQDRNLNLKLVDNEKNSFLLEGDTTIIDDQSVLNLPGVITMHRLTIPYKLVSRAFHPENTICKVGNVTFGGNEQIIIAGPCSVESQEQIDMIAQEAKSTGVSILRGGAFKPRTSPYYFQGLQEVGLKYLYNAGKKYDMPIVSEIVRISQIPLFIELCDLIQVGARNMQNFELLKELGKTRKPILLKRSPSATIEEWLMSAEYILKEGNPNVILCERGIKSFEKATRYTLDLSTIQIVKKLSHLPIICDPSHATGDYSLIESMIYASVAASADGVMIEVHNNPKEALSDGRQSLKTEKLEEVLNKARKISQVIDRFIK